MPKLKLQDMGTQSVVFQPVMPLPWQLSDQVEYYEILSRVVRPEGGLWSLQELLGCPHRALVLDSSVLRQPAGALKFYKEDAFGINVTSTSLADPRFMEAIENLALSLDRPSRLVIEIGEAISAHPKVIEDLLVALERLKAIGVRTALDDFGRGGAGMAVFSLFEFDFLKVSPLVDIRHPRGRTLLKAIVDAAHATEAFHVVLESVEDEETLKVANEVGAFFVQGFHIGRPNQQPIAPAIPEFDPFS